MVADEPEEIKFPCFKAAGSVRVCSTCSAVFQEGRLGDDTASIDSMLSHLISGEGTPLSKISAPKRNVANTARAQLRVDLYNVTSTQHYSTEEIRRFRNMLINLEISIALYFSPAISCFNGMCMAHLLL